MSDRISIGPDGLRIEDSVAGDVTYPIELGKWYSITEMYDREADGSWRSAGAFVQPKDDGTVRES